jgi:glyoxylase-like metal-dependent hydrolase (beta-lactamase superfamily II)
MRTVLLQTDYFWLDGGAMFGVVPKALWSRQVKADSENRIRMTTWMVYVETGERRVLVDVGVGSGYDAKFVRNLGIEGGARLPAEVLSEVGIRPEEITDVILTHLHFDHCGGLTRPDAGGRWVPAFPNARHHVQGRQLEHARKALRRDRASYRPERFEPVAEAGLFELRDGSGPLFEGVELFVVDGHTPAMQVPLIGLEGGRKLFVPSDLVPMRAHVALPWVMAFDRQPLRTLEEKQELLDRAADEGWLVVMQHDPECAMVQIGRGEKDFEAVPCREQETGIEFA